MPVPEPYSPACQARALYASTTSAANSCLSSCVYAPGVLYGSDVVSPGALGPAAEARIGNMGGLNVGVDLGVYYDPSSRSMRAPIATTADGTLVTAPSLDHGPAIFPAFGDVEGDRRPRTQYAPYGCIDVDPLVWDVYNGPCACGAACYAANGSGSVCLSPYAFAQSIASLLVTARNAVKVRDGLQAAGLVVLTPALRSLDPKRTCACRLMGGPENFSGLANFAMQYTDTSIMQLLDVRAEVAFLTNLYVTQVTTDVRSQVIAAARANYARAEGPRAFLQPRLVSTDAADDAVDATVMASLPEALPGTGVRVSLEDSAFAARALLDPRACFANRVAMACQTGLAIGAAPCVRPDSLQSENPCADARCVELEQFLPVPRLYAAPLPFVL